MKIQISRKLQQKIIKVICLPLLLLIVKKQLDISLVYLGNKLPKYLIKNLYYLKSTFPNENFVFISDSESSLSKVQKLGIKIWKFNSLSNYQEKYQSYLQHNFEFRSNFWFNTLARFFAIYEYMNENFENSHLHLEADNFLFPNFPFDYFKDCPNILAFPLESRNMGVATIMYLPNFESSKILIEFTRKEILAYPKSTDMTILGALANSTNYEVANLRVIPRELSYQLRSIENWKFFASDQNLPGVFDAITHGQYLLGIDPRNFRGLRKVYSSISTHEVQPSKLNYQYRNQDDVLMITDGNQSWPIYNLHNHSKDLRIYSRRKRSRVLKKRIEQNSGTIKVEFVPMTFIKSFLSSIFRRIRRFSL